VSETVRIYGLARPKRFFAPLTSVLDILVHLAPVAAQIAGPFEVHVTFWTTMVESWFWFFQVWKKQ
jgi:hypothetical protein